VNRRGAAADEKPSSSEVDDDDEEDGGSKPKHRVFASLVSWERSRKSALSRFRLAQDPEGVDLNFQNGVREPASNPPWTAEVNRRVT